MYPARGEGDRWRAVWYENGRRRQCQSATEDGLAARIEKVAARLAADAPGLELPGADLIGYYLSPGRHPAAAPWSRKHADTQARLCRRYVAPVIGGLACQDIKAGHMQAVVNAAPTAQEGARLRRCISALVTAGLAGGYLANPRLKEVHWQAGDRPAPQPQASIAGEAGLYVDPAEIPAAADVARLGDALAALAQGYELMACFAAYTGLRWGELAALTIGQINPAARTVTVDRKVIEIGGTLYVEAPKGRKQRRTIYPTRTPRGYGPPRRHDRRPHRSRPSRPARRYQPPGAGLRLPAREALAVLQPSPGASWHRPTSRRDGATPTATAPGSGTACGTCSAPPPCSPGRWTPPTSPAWPGTPTSASPSTCTSAPPPAPSTAPAPPPNNTSSGTMATSQRLERSAFAGTA